MSQSSPSVSPESSLEAAVLSTLELKEKLDAESPKGKLDAESSKDPLKPKSSKDQPDPESLKEMLRHMLSNHSVISTSSSVAERQEATPQSEELQTFRVIGRGACGTVFEQTGLGHVLKLATDPSPDELWNDCKVHTQVADALGSLNLSIQIPLCHYFALGTDSRWWESNLEKFPPRFQVPNHVLCTERILPLPLVIRNSLIDLYCAPARIPQAKNDAANKDCLVRLYLGKRRESAAPSRFFTLRNMILHRDQMEYLELDVKYYAELMADTLAVIHWKAGYDGRDIEFVLGSAPATVCRPADKDDFTDEKPAHSTWKKVMSQHSFTKRRIHLWVLDFNQCRSMSMDEAGVDGAVEAFFLNDPYYPRPLSPVEPDRELWRVFRDRYLERSRQVLVGEVVKGVESLPERFIEKVIEKQQQRLISRGKMEGGAEEQDT